MPPITITTLLRLADNTTREITITRGDIDHSWGVVDPTYTGRRCSLCDLPYYSPALCEFHYRKLRRAKRKLRIDTAA